MSHFLCSFFSFAQAHKDTPSYFLVNILFCFHSLGHVGHRRQIRLEGISRGYVYIRSALNKICIYIYVNTLNKCAFVIYVHAPTIINVHFSSYKDSLTHECFFYTHARALSLADKHWYTHIHMCVCVRVCVCMCKNV